MFELTTQAVVTVSFLLLSKLSVLLKTGALAVIHKDDYLCKTADADSEIHV